MTGRDYGSHLPASYADWSAEGASWSLEWSLPEHWFFLSGRPETDQLQASADVDARLRRRPRLDGYREAMLDPLLGLSRTLERMPGLVGAAFRWELTDHGLVTATVILRRYERPAGPVDTELDIMSALASERQPIDEFAPQVSIVDLPLGRAVRREVVIQPPAEPGASSPLHLVVNHWAPLDFAPTRTVGMRADTCNLAMTRTLLPEFDAIAEGCLLRLSDQGADTQSIRGREEP